MSKKIKSAPAFAAICVIIAMSTLAIVEASTIAVLNVIPTSDSKEISVIGNGFNPNDTVYLALANATTGVVIYNFTETITTTNMGTFTANITLPSSIYGTYLIYAKTSTVSASKEYTVIASTNQINPRIIATPPNSNIFKVTGSGFNPYQMVFFRMMGNNPNSVYNFTDLAITDTLGNFTITLIIPTSISGNYTLIDGTQTGTTTNTNIL